MIALKKAAKIAREVELEKAKKAAKKKPTKEELARKK